jgi:hypothetical protein
MLGGALFIFGALLGVLKGAIPLKAGGAIEKGKDRFGFWAAVICLVVIGVSLLWIAHK